MSHEVAAGTTDQETAIVTAIEERRDELVALASQLIAFDTITHRPDDLPREEIRLQEFVAARLEAVGADVDLWEPRYEDVAQHTQVPRDHSFAGRPQMIATFPRAGATRKLLFAGHVDVVPVAPLERWTSHPFQPDVRDGKLYGRGACDMKGGVAAMLIAVETLRELGIDTPAQLLVNTVTDEETCGAGTLASLAHGLTADAGIVPEPTGWALNVTCRGILNLYVTVNGRPGHATRHQPHWTEGGAVNAIEKMSLVIQAVERLRADWSQRGSLHHDLLPPPTILPTLIDGGEWRVTYPAKCRTFFDIAYLPGQADAAGQGSKVREEIEAWLAAGTASDSWLAQHPPELEWTNDIPPGEVSPDSEIVAYLQGAAASVYGEPRLAGLPSWHDAASLNRVGRIPTVDFGIPSTAPDGTPLIHAFDEYAEVDDLVRCAQTLALAAVRFR